MSAGPLVSAITIFLNEERFLEEAVASVFAQTYDRWELLLVDDGSSDRSTDVARRLAAQQPDRVRYLEHPGHANRGMSASRNLGVRHARGEFVAFLDADDVWLPDKLERQLAILSRETEAAVLFGGSQVWYGWTGRPSDVKKDVAVTMIGRTSRIQNVQDPAERWPLDRVVAPPRLLSLVYPLGRLGAPSISGLMARRGVIQQVGGFEDGFTDMFEDHAFRTKVFSKVPVFVSSEIFDRYRQHPNSTCAKAGRAHSYATHYLRFLEWCAAYLSEQDAQNAAAWKAVWQRRRQLEHPKLARWGELLQLAKNRGPGFAIRSSLQPLQRRVGRLRRLSGPERRLLASAVLTLGLMRLGLWTLPFRTIRSVMQRFGRPVRRLTHRSDESIARVSWAIKSASRYVPRATCLTQAIAGKILLSRRGHDARLRIGVTRDASGLSAHAWVEAEGRVVLGGTDSHVRRYAALPQLAD